jgi:hypothetical protein
MVGLWYRDRNAGIKKGAQCRILKLLFVTLEHVHPRIDGKLSPAIMFA